MKDIRESMDRDSSRRSDTKEEDTDKKEEKNKRGEKKVSFEREVRFSPPPKPQRRPTARGAKLTPSNESSPTESTLAFRQLEEKLHEAYKATGGDEWPVTGEPWSPPPPVSKKRKLDVETESPMKFPWQSRYMFSSNGSSNIPAGIIPPGKQIFPMEGVPSNGGGIPCVVPSMEGSPVLVGGSLL